MVILRLVLLVLSPLGAVSQLVTVPFAALSWERHYTTIYITEMKGYVDKQEDLLPTVPSRHRVNNGESDESPQVKEAV